MINRRPGVLIHLLVEFQVTAVQRDQQLQLSDGSHLTL